MENNIKALKEFNKDTDPNNTEDIEDIERNTLNLIKDLKREIKDCMDDNVILSILRDIGIAGLLTSIGLTQGSLSTALSSVISACTIYALHHNRNIRRNKSLIFNGKRLTLVKEENYFNY